MATESLPFGGGTPPEDVPFFDGLLGELDPLALLPDELFSFLGEFLVEVELLELELCLTEPRLPDIFTTSAYYKVTFILESTEVVPNKIRCCETNDAGSCAY